MKNTLIGIGVVVLGITLMVATNGNIAIVAAGVFAAAMFVLMIAAIGETVTGDKGWKGVVVGVIILIIAMLLMPKGCNHSSDDDYDVGRVRL